jgi:hypothetical protein
VQESLRSVAKNLLRNHLSHCANNAMHGDKAQQAAMVDELVALVGKIAAVRMHGSEVHHELPLRMPPPHDDKATGDGVEAVCAADRGGGGGRGGGWRGDRGGGVQEGCCGQRRSSPTAERMTTAATP